MISISSFNAATIAYAKPIESVGGNADVAFDAAVDVQDKIAELTERQTNFAAKNASLGSTEYAQAKLDISAQLTALRIQSGEDLDTMNVKVGDRLFTVAAKQYDITQLQLARTDAAPIATLAV